jgi:hypothetical protein
MIPDCHQLQQMLGSFSLVKDCDQPADGLLRIATPFQYPDGSLIDVFLAYDHPLYPGGYILSDFGQTAVYLLHFVVRPWESKGQRQVITDICDLFKVHSARGVLSIGLEEDQLPKELPMAVVRLAQACVRVADLYTMAKPRVGSTFREDVREFILESGLPVDSPFELPGRHGESVFVDFRVRGHKKNSLLQAMPAKGETLPHLRSNEIFASWYELQDLKSQNQFITVVEDKISKARQGDIGRLRDFSEIVYFPRERAHLRTIIAA